MTIACIAEHVLKKVILYVVIAQTFSNSADHEIYQNHHYCQVCYDALFFICDNCGNVFHTVDATIRRDRTLCPHCVVNNKTWDIHRLPLPRGEFRFGIELETSDCPYSETLEGKTCFGCKRDGSIDGMEFVSPPLSGKLGFDKINEFLKLAADNDFEVDKKCGFHLHLNMDGLAMSDLQKIIYAYYLSEETWRLFISEDRRNNNYCKKIAWKIENIFNCETHSEFFNFLSNINDNVGRYCWFNILAYYEHHTFEIRSHEGTLDQAAIENWIKLHIAFCQWSMTHTFEQIEKTMTHINLNKVRCIIQDDSLVTYYANKVGLGVVSENTELQAA